MCDCYQSIGATRSSGAPVSSGARMRVGSGAPLNASRRSQRGVAAAEAPGRITIIPTAGALENFAGYTHEFIGWWVYRMRGWV